VAAPTQALIKNAETIDFIFYLYILLIEATERFHNTYTVT
jgi:hypothetical protein